MTQTVGIIGRRNTLLIEVIEKLKSNELQYNWATQESDTIGLIAQVLTGLDQNELANVLLKGRLDLMMALEEIPEKEFTPYDLNFWGPMLEHSIFCEEKLGRKEYKKLDLFDQLNAAGITNEELFSIQHMNNPDVVKEANIDANNKKFLQLESNVINYFIALTEIECVTELN